MSDLEALDVRYRGRPPAGGEHARRCLELVQSEGERTRSRWTLPDLGEQSEARLSGSERAPHIAGTQRKPHETPG